MRKSIKEKNHRDTKQRQIILNEIRKIYNHPTAREVYRLARKKLPNIGLATVYRTLDYLEKEKLIIRLKSTQKEARYDAHMEGHCHLICDNCGSVADIFDVNGLNVQSKQLNKSGFMLTLDFLELHGMCKKCQ